MKKLVALLLAALMLFACTALAEIDPGDRVLAFLHGQ